MSEDNSHAGQGAVMLDIGGSVGAVVVTMPTAMIGTEIEARARSNQPDDTPGNSHHPHAAVINRPGDGDQGHPVASLVLAELDEGVYELHERPDGSVQLTVTVVGGAVTRVSWPESAARKST